MAHYAFVFWDTLSVADRIAFVALIVAICVAILPLFGGGLCWVISLQSRLAIQTRELESIRSELDLVQEFMADRIRNDLQVVADLAALKERCAGLERRMSDLERE